MQQDSLQHAPAPALAEEAAAEPQAEQAEAQPARPIRRAVTDTVKPDPRLMKPLPPGEPLTMRPRLLTEDYWAHGLLQADKAAFVQQLDSLTGTGGIPLTLQTPGIAGDPVPYRFKTDNIVTITLMVSFFLVVWVISRSRHYLRERVKDFFYTRQRDSLFAERTETELRGQLFLIFQTCFLLAILFFDVTQERQVEVFNQVSPYKLLGVSTGICCLYYLLKIGMYAFVNSIFFDRRESKRWAEAYLLCVLALGVALLPVALLVVYFNLSFAHLTLLFACILIIDKILLFYKCYSIFFNYTLGWVHLILYFCTLEILPLFILFRALVYANSFLLTIN